MTREDELFMEFRQGIPKTPHIKRRRRPWIYEETWRVIDVRVNLRKDPPCDQIRVKALGMLIRALLTGIGGGGQRRT